MKISRVLLICTIAIIIGIACYIIPKTACLGYAVNKAFIPMRDGNLLYTEIYTPRFIRNAPIILFRTPYCASSKTSYRHWEFDGRGYMGQYIRAGYIVVLQDVRGRYLSEGTFEHIRPLGEDYCEESDTYDTVEWLINNVNGNNGCVGLAGCSYPGFYSLIGGICRHPAIKAICPQAPVTDWYRGDDAHHNGVLALADCFSFLATMDVDGQNHMPSMKEGGPRPKIETNIYDYFLAHPTLKENCRISGEGSYMDEIKQHPDLDDWWKARQLDLRCNRIECPVLIVGGANDAEDLYGTWASFKAIDETAPTTYCKIVFGPWSHGGWKSGQTSLGEMSWGEETNLRYYMDHFELNFFNHFLKGEDLKYEISKYNIFLTGSNKWIQFDDEKEFRKLECRLQNGEKESTSFISDPSRPVPYTAPLKAWRDREYMNASQTFMHSFSNESVCFTPFTTNEQLDLLGPVNVHLDFVASTTDVDLTVRLVDVFPEDDCDHPGCEMLLRMDAMRARYRNSFENPSPLIPNEEATMDFTLPYIAHTLAPGHKLRVYISGSCFPLFELSPQQYINLWECNREDFISSKIDILPSSCIDIQCKY